MGKLPTVAHRQCKKSQKRIKHRTQAVSVKVASGDGGTSLQYQYTGGRDRNRISLSSRTPWTTELVSAYVALLHRENLSNSKRRMRRRTKRRRRKEDAEEEDEKEEEQEENCETC